MLIGCSLVTRFSGVLRLEDISIFGVLISSSYVSKSPILVRSELMWLSNVVLPVRLRHAYSSPKSQGLYIVVGYPSQKISFPNFVWSFALFMGFGDDSNSKASNGEGSIGFLGYDL